MRKFWRSWILILLVLLFSGKVGLERYTGSTTMEEVSPRKVVYWLAQSHSEEAVLGGLMAGLGFKEVLSDLFFLQSIQYFGDWMETKESKFRKAYPVLRAMGVLSPHFVPGYSFGALIMEETGHVDKAISFLDEGIENNPYAFELRIYRDFMIRLFKTHEYEKAIKGIKEAIELPDHPPILERILAFAYEKNGQIRESILQWRNVFLASESERIREITNRNMKRLLGILIEKEGKEKALYWFEEEVLENLRK
ncbi:MAG: tetratricopeptide repeat protein [bacterium]